MQEKHGGSQFAALKNLGKFFPPWTVPCDFWHAALWPDVSGVAVDVKLFHDSGRRLVHKYQIYRDPIPNPVAGVVRKLIDFACRTMAIAQLTHLHLTIPASGLVVEPVRRSATRLFHFPERRCCPVGFHLPGRLQS